MNIYAQVMRERSKAKKEESDSENVKILKEMFEFYYSQCFLWIESAADQGEFEVNFGLPILRDSVKVQKLEYTNNFVHNFYQSIKESIEYKKNYEQNVNYMKFSKEAFTEIIQEIERHLLLLGYEAKLISNSIYQQRVISIRWDKNE